MQAMYAIDNIIYVTAKHLSTLATSAIKEMEINNKKINKLIEKRKNTNNLSSNNDNNNNNEYKLLTFSDVIKNNPQLQGANELFEVRIVINNITIIVILNNIIYIILSLLP